MTERRVRNFFPSQIIETLLVLSIIVGYLFVISILNHISFAQCLREAYLGLYFPQYNLCYVGVLGGMFVYIHVFFMIALGAVSIHLWRHFSGATMRLSPAVYTACVLLSLLLVIQSGNFFRLFLIETTLFSEKSSPEKKALLFNDIYTFAEFCRKNLPGKHAGYLLTDMDLTSTAGFQEHFTLMYHLYPIRIQYNPRQKTETGVVDFSTRKDCLILFRKTNAQEHVPAGYRILAQLNDNNLIAVKENYGF